MPCCPDQQGTMPRSCGTPQLTCCAIYSREETRRTARPEKSTRDQKPALVNTEYRTPPPPTLERRDRHLRDGLRFEKPVFDLKNDFRI